MSFAYPWVLASLFLLPLWGLYYRRNLNRSVLEYSSTHGLSQFDNSIWKYVSHLPVFFRMASVALIILALARPQLVEHQVRTSGDGLDILLSIDTSGSMEEEISYKGRWLSRLSAAKVVVNDFISQRPDDRIGLVVFGEQAFTQAPLTLDHEVLSQFIENIYRGMAGNGTAIGSAILTSVKRMKELKSKSKVVILLTDGAQTSGAVAPESAAKAAKELGVKIYTIGIGDRRSRSLDEATLKEVARITGGRYFNARNVESLIQVYETINSLEKSKVEVKDFSRYHEKMLLFLWPAFFFFFVEILFALSRWRVLA